MTPEDEDSPRPGPRSKHGRMPTTARRPARRSRIRPLLLAAGVLTAYAFLVLVSRTWGLEWGPLLVAVAGTPYAVVVGVLAIALAAAALHRWAALAALVVTLLLGSTQVPLFVASPDADSKERAMVVMTANLGFGAGDIGPLMKAVREQGVDLLAVQELTDEAAAKLVEAGIQKELPHTFLEAAPGAAGSGVWSKFPLSETRVLPGFTYKHLVARVAASDPAPVDLTVVVVHPAAPSLLAHGTSDEEHRMLRAELAALPGSVIALGDFNATQDNLALRNLAEDKFRNAVDMAGSGLTFTFGPRLTRLPLFGLDHVLLRGPLAARTTSTVPIPGSRHRAVVAELVR